MAIELTKSMRMLMVWEAVEFLGKATPKQILDQVAQRAGADGEDANFKRNIYRDLKELADKGKIAARHYSPDGSELEPDNLDALKNVRIEYSLLDHSEEQKIVGWKILAEANATFFNSQKRKLNWEAQAPGASPLFTGRLSMVIPGSGRQPILLHLSDQDFPAKIVLCRQTQTKSEAEHCVDLIRDEFGNRCVALFVSDNTLSRAIPGKRFGHAVISVLPGKPILCRDLGSSAGTSFAKTSIDEVQSMFASVAHQATAQLDGDLMRKNLEFTAINGSDLSLPNPCVLKLGDFRIVLILGT